MKQKYLDYLNRQIRLQCEVMLLDNEKEVLDEVIVHARIGIIDGIINTGLVLDLLDVSECEEFRGICETIEHEALTLVADRERKQPTAEIDKNDRNSEVIDALVKLGVRGSIKVTVLDPNRSIIKVNGEQFGIYDFVKHTFID